MEEIEERKRVLLVNITRLGDMLQATPTIVGIKEENPDCEITVLVEEQFKNICHHLPAIDHVVGIDLNMVVRSLARESDGTGVLDAYEYVSELIDELRQRNFDYCLNMSSSAYTALLIKLINAPRHGGWSADEEGYRRIESGWAQLFASSVFHLNRTYNSLNLVDIFRASAKVRKSPQHLVMKVDEVSINTARTLIKEAFSDVSGPLIAIQAGASQGKRQLKPTTFAETITLLQRDLGARIILTGGKGEIAIGEAVLEALENNEQVLNLIGRTSLGELGGVLREADLLLTGDTGPMHMSVAVGTPVVALFLASAYGFETGPYFPECLILQPVISCGPCNPNKECSSLECHDLISPQYLATLIRERLKGPVTYLPSAEAESKRVTTYRTFFDNHGFLNLSEISHTSFDTKKRYRDAYRKLWLDDLGGYKDEEKEEKSSFLSSFEEEAFAKLFLLGVRGETLINELTQEIFSPKGPPKRLGEISDLLTKLDQEIEQLGFHYEFMCPLTKMFAFGRENLQGSDALKLASQMSDVYHSLLRRLTKFKRYLEN
jgi:ADP-heptose:LPS heptosyltransferase